MELTPLQKKAWDLYQSLINDLRTHTKLFLVIGKKLKTIRDEKIYRHLGEGGFDSFEQFLNNAEIGLRKSTAYLYIRIYEYYIERIQLKEDEVLKVPINRLMRLLPKLKTKENEEAKEIVLNMGELTNYDFDVEVKEQKLDIERPYLYKDKETGKWIFEFNEEQVLKIVNKTTNEVLFENVIEIK